MALGALAATVIGGEDKSQAPGNPPPPGFEQVVDADRVQGDPPGGRPSTAKGPRVFYYETSTPLTVPDGPGGMIVKKCPKGSIATNGYWYIDQIFDGFGLSDQGSSPAGFRRWAFYWRNESGGPIENLILGMVCDRDG
ncbi:MAG: hypothetical protein ABI726_07405 [bacterium]